jgi:hypothetical protein
MSSFQCKKRKISTSIFLKVKLVFTGHTGCRWTYTFGLCFFSPLIFLFYLWTCEVDWITSRQLLHDLIWNLDLTCWTEFNDNIEEFLVSWISFLHLSFFCSTHSIAKSKLVKTLKGMIWCMNHIIIEFAIKLRVLQSL